MPRHPYQCIASVEQSTNPKASNGYLIAACGSKLVSLSIAEGSIVSKWQPSELVEAKDDPQEHEEPPPAKKQKTTQFSQTEPKVILLVTSPDQQHIVAVTDDKCVQVFSIDGHGKLGILSQRFMPKRPCAIEVLPDNATIICGDKFGDVYSLPLLPQQSVNIPEVNSGAQSESPVPTKEGPTKPAEFKPSATNLTVHTMRNRKALEAQLRQKEFATKKEPLKFEHQLLLGHVSMLTDLTFATQEVDGRLRRYIITADRDEHIRVSRAPPQSHVIEGFCLGHTEFISTICVIPGTTLLVSAGGDDWLGVWEWPSFQLKKKVYLSAQDSGSAYATFAGSAEPTSAQQSQRIAVSGLWVVPVTTGDVGSTRAVLVSSERMSSLFVIPLDILLSDSVNESYKPSIHTDGPVLDVATIGKSVVISSDPMSRGQRDDGGSRLTAWQLGLSDDSSLLNASPDSELQNRLDAPNQASRMEEDDKQLDGFLFTVSQMRKRRDHEVQDEEGEREEDA